MAFSFGAVVWSVCVAIYLILIIIAYATPEWIVSNNSTEYYSSMGPIVACVRSENTTDVCGRYGDRLTDWPVRAWRVALIFDAIVLALVIIVLVLSWFTCFCCFTLHTFSKLFLSLAQLLILLGIFAFVGGLRDSSDPINGVSTCMSSTAFRPGEGCSFGWSGIVACIALVWGMVPTIWAFCMSGPNEYEEGSEA